MSKSISLSNKLVAFKNNQLVTTSLVVAEGTKSEHESIMRLIQKYQAEIERWGQIYFSDLKSGNKRGDLRGRPTRFAYLNEQQATFLVTLLRNNDVVVAFKCELVDQFYKMRSKLASLSQDEIKRRILREQSKVTRHEFTDSIKPFVDREKPANPNLYYSAPTSFIQNHLCGIPNGGRDSATGEQLAMLIVLEGAGKRTFNQADDRGDQFNKAYTDVRNATTRLKQYINGEIPLLN